MLRPRDFRLVGHYCHDTIVAKDGTGRLALGGPPARASAVLSALGCAFDVVAKVGDDFRYAALAPRPARIVRGRLTTAFVDDYRSTERAGTVVAAAPAIDPGDLGDAPCRIGMALGIAAEIGPQTLGRLRELSQIALGDAQAFVRHATPEARRRSQGTDTRIPRPKLGLRHTRDRPAKRPGRERVQQRRARGLRPPQRPPS